MKYLRPIRSPLETAYFGCMRDQLCYSKQFGISVILIGSYMTLLVLRYPDVVIVHHARSCASRKDMLVPSHDTYTSVMAVHGPEFGTLFDVPDLDFPTYMKGKLK